MKKIIYMLLAVLLLGTASAMQAQTNNSINRQKPVLLADNLPSGMSAAFGSLINGYGTITGSISDLSSKQESRILRIESSRDKKLTKIDDRIENTNQQLKSQKEKLSDKQIKKGERKVLNLLLDRQQVIAKAKKSIVKQLTPALKEKAGWSNL